MLAGTNVRLSGEQAGGRPVTDTPGTSGHTDFTRHTITNVQHSCGNIYPHQAICALSPHAVRCCARYLSVARQSTRSVPELNILKLAQQYGFDVPARYGSSTSRSSVLLSQT